MGRKSPAALSARHYTFAAGKKRGFCRLLSAVRLRRFRRDPIQLPPAKSAVFARYFSCRSNQLADLARDIIGGEAEVGVYVGELSRRTESVDADHAAIHADVTPP